MAAWFLTSPPATDNHWTQVSWCSHWTHESQSILHNFLNLLKMMVGLKMMVVIPQELDSRLLKKVMLELELVRLALPCMWSGCSSGPLAAS